MSPSVELLHRPLRDSRRSPNTTRCAAELRRVVGHAGPTLRSGSGFFELGGTVEHPSLSRPAREMSSQEVAAVSNPDELPESRVHFRSSAVLEGTRCQWQEAAYWSSGQRFVSPAG